MRRNALDDNVLGTAHDAQTLTLDHTLVTLTEESLVGGDGDTEGTGLVTAGCDQQDSALRRMPGSARHLLFDRHGRCTRLVVGAPVVGVDGNLAARAGTPRSAASFGGGALASGEVVAVSC